MDSVVGRFYIHKKSGVRYFAHRGTVFHTEDNENLVLYWNEQGKGFARPQAMFEDGRFTPDPDQTPWQR